MHAYTRTVDTGSAKEISLKHDVCVITGGRSLHFSKEQAERLVADEVADWEGPGTIRLREQPKHGKPLVPECRELTQFNARLVGVRKDSYNPRLSEEKQAVLHDLEREIKRRCPSPQPPKTY